MSNQDEWLDEVLEVYANNHYDFIVRGVPFEFDRDQAKQAILNHYKDYIPRSEVLRIIEASEQHNRKMHGVGECKSCALAEMLKANLERTD